jgi:hypothetical protein
METELIEFIENFTSRFYPSWLDKKDYILGYSKMSDIFEDEVIFYIEYDGISLDYYGMRLVRKFKKLRSQLIPYNIKNGTYPDNIAIDIGCFGTNLIDQNLGFNNFEADGIECEEYKDLGIKILESFDYNYSIINRVFANEASVLKYIYSLKVEDLNSILFTDEVVKILNNSTK